MRPIGLISCDCESEGGSRDCRDERMLLAFRMTRSSGDKAMFGDSVDFAVWMLFLRKGFLNVVDDVMSIGRFPS